MGRMNKITEKEKRLLLILVTVLILVGSYQFGYQKFHSMAIELESKNQELTGRLIELQQKQAKKQKMIDETTKYKAGAKTILEQYPRLLTQEKNIIFVTELEQYANMKVDSIAFNEMTIFYTPDGVPITDTSTETDVLTETENSVQEKDNEVAENSLTAETNSDESIIQNSLTGYESTIILTYQSTYEGLKKAIEFINTYHEKRHISDITASFDMTTGNLSGTISVVLYEAGDGTNYEAPVLDNLGVGKDNIFGTFEN